MKFVIQHWILLERERDEKGKLIRRKGYRRTKEPRAEREVEVIEVLSRTRVLVSFSLGSRMVFSVKTGRALGLENRDWVVKKESLRAIRKYVRENAPEEDDEEAPPEARESAANDVSS
jgi:hypothetical protein